MGNKRLMALLLALVMALGGCARQDGTEGASAPAAAPESASQADVVELQSIPQFGEPAAQPESEPEPARPSLENMMAVIDTLCAAPRPMGSAEEYRVAQYLRDLLWTYGYETELEQFEYDVTSTTLSERYRFALSAGGEAFLQAAQPGGHVDGVSHNVVGRQAWEAEKSGILVLSAHYDSTWDSIGVLDNATGVAVVLEAARMLADEDLPFAVRIVFFGGEEEILIGSRLHVLGMDEAERARIIGNINVDTLAYSAEEVFVAVTALSLSQQDAQTLAAASPVAGALLADERVQAVFQSRLVSDHMSFAAAGIDSVNFGQSVDEVMDLINSPRDTYELLAPEGLAPAAELLAEAVLGLAASMEDAA